ncbi:MAG TPA: sulfotransferase [Actinomycetota bacterium]|nr:sulfotransferase [Actinomycetota bacterium]
MGDVADGIRVIYVLGPGRSGSGVLGRLLSTIPGAAFLGELRRVWSRGFRPGRTCGCGRPHAECPVWSAVLVPGSPAVDPVRTEIAALQRRVAPEHLGWSAALRERRRTDPPDPGTPAGRYVAAYTELHRAVAAAAGATLVIDSSKSAADAALLAFREEVPTYLVQLIRDPRGVVSSLQRHAGVRSIRARRALAVRGAARWTAKHLANEALRRRSGPERSIALRYEDLIAHPADAVESVAKLVGLPSPLERLAPGVPIPVPEVHGPDGSRRRRFETDRVVLELDTRWHRELDPVDRRLITALTFPLLRRYGYPARVDAP